MSEHKLDRDVQPDRLAEELAKAHGWADTPTLRTRAPGQTDEDGQPVEGLLLIDRDADPATVAAVVAAHAAVVEPVPPLTGDEITRLRTWLATNP